MLMIGAGGTIGGELTRTTIGMANRSKEIPGSIPPGGKIQGIKTKDGVAKLAHRDPKERNKMAKKAKAKRLARNDAKESKLA